MVFQCSGDVITPVAHHRPRTVVTGQRFCIIYLVFHVIGKYPLGIVGVNKTAVKMRNVLNAIEERARGRVMLCTRIAQVAYPKTAIGLIGNKAAQYAAQIAEITLIVAKVWPG